MAAAQQAAVQAPASQQGIVIAIPPALPGNIAPEPIGAQQPQNIHMLHGAQANPLQNAAGNPLAIEIVAHTNGDGPAPNQVPSPLGGSLYGWVHGN
ncbi:unnamed protein product [Rhizoctonia solani]|uniref:Uncharacterized protein n=1 Tax=Rhizoctonia solani TaxID=456999 RepID=A0A8H3GLN4_9AGAM|nr:unnamed protein product [Rhizoctonia solani]